MFLPLLLVAGTAAGVGSILNGQTFKEGNPEMHASKVLGIESSKLALWGGLAGGTLAAMSGAPMLAAPLLGAAAGAWNNRDSVARVRTAFAEFLDDRLMIDSDPEIDAEDTRRPPRARVTRRDDDDDDAGDPGDLVDLIEADAGRTLHDRLVA